MDDLDKALIGHLRTDARQSVATLARKLRVARTTVQSRLDRLETSGAIAGYTVKLGAEALRPLIRASVLVGIEPRSQAAILSRLRAMPEIERAFTTSGRFDLLLQVAAESTTALDAVLDAVGGLPGVRLSESLIHLTTRIDRAQ
ncbi:Lrp/AsnC family transcriptional regulator [Pararhodobacter oceanensis]|uniref:AsnC family transcriptional regulator n=1 Tax=Pararhodobacter oceanensis TaxID=2172121 RepID=A0A2T8HYI5_9RHOB|nr:Lrp/AsnC family transcriptional regulator [Pararhodobacter oceanensis]PVH30459.1 AsnC family transcriptional regulator [Pararhodobacter oceanensis]